MKELGLQTIPVAAISLGLRLRVVDEVHAQHLAENIQEIGRLRSPIEVRKVKGRAKVDAYTIIAGGHRFRAVQLLGWTEVPAFVFEMTEQEARIWEIDENIRRHELNPLDRAVFLAERQRLYEELHPETAAGVAGGKARQGAANEIVSFATDTAQRCGLTPRTIQLAVSIAKGLPQAIRQRIAGTPLAQKQSELLALIKLSPSEQTAVLDLLLAEPPQCRSVASAEAFVKGVHEPDLSPTEAKFQKLVFLWGRAGREAQRQFLAHLKESGALDEMLAADKQAARGEKEAA
jgi:ParB family chromosome partitioning protein